MKAYLERPDIGLLERAAANMRDRLLIRVLFYSGCRVTQALGLRPEDIDFETGDISIIHLKLRLHLSCPECRAALTKASVFCPKCGIKVTSVVARELEHVHLHQPTIDADTLTMLKGYIDRGRPVSRGGKRWIFGINRHRAWQIIRECADRASLPKLINSETGKMRGVSPRRLRDAFAVNAMKHDDSGDGLRLPQEQLGHASFNTTARYRKISGEEHRAWYSKLWDSDEKKAKNGGPQGPA